MKFADIPKVNRPREKLMSKGVEYLKDTDLLAILLRTGKKGLNVIELSERVLKKYPLSKLSSLECKDLLDIEGLDVGKASTIIASFELTKRALKAHGKGLPIIQDPQDAVALLTRVRRQKKEHFVVLYINARNQLIDQEIISIGTINSTIIHPREVFEPAVKMLAAQVILAHNHPSGDVTPSEEDELVTKRMVQAGLIMGIDVVDHIILSTNDYLSMREDGFFENISQSGSL